MTSSKLIKIVIKGLIDKIGLSRYQYQKRKLRKLLLHAQQNSVFYRELYKDIDIENITPYTIGELPPVIKAQFIENYDDVVCDSNISKEAVLEFSSDTANIHKLFLNKYIVDSTSGTTGEKLKVVNEENEFNYMTAMGAIYTWPKIQYAIDILLSKRPLVYIAPTDGFYASVIISNIYLGLSTSTESEIIDFRLPIDQLVEKLNRINPILIGGYVSTFLTLVEEAKEGRLKIDVKYMVSIGTIYSENDRQTVKDTFNCETFTSYSSTEAGEIACECVNGHFHISNDVIVEAVDDLMYPVEDNTESNCILITNLWNTTMPFIRYRINDRCIIHSEKCGCGRKEKWIEVMGREPKKISFISNDNRKITLTDFMFEAILNETCNGYADHQLIINNNHIELRFNINNDIIKYQQFKTIKQRILDLANQNNLDLHVSLSSKPLKIDQSGKIRRIIFNN